MKRRILLGVLGLFMAITMNAQQGYTITDTIFDRYADTTFAFGADISWGGSDLKDKNGVPKDLLTILKEQGLNAVRYRVWYPDNGPSGKNEVVRNAKEAHDQGFKVMIDFHYSDSWADPGKQYIPSAWEGHTTEQLIQDVYDHTYDVLGALKDVGVTPAWVQIGNETKRGMLWPNGNTNDTPGGMDNFAEMIKSGYKAIKDIDTTIQAIVHLPDADENSLYRWMFDALESRGVEWDIIGMSAYPRWAHLDWETEIDMSVANMLDMIDRYETKVMVVETGHYWYEPYISNHFMVELMDTMMSFGGLGCFWWEPQSMFGYELTAWDPATRQPTIAMDAYLGVKHTDPSQFMEISLDEPTDNSIFDLDQTINLFANASHARGEIEKVAFYVNDEMVTELSSEPYSYEMPNPGTGIYSIYAVAIDTNNIELDSETVTIQVGSVTMYQENADGYCGITNNEGSVDSDHDNYTGNGFINTDNVIGSTVNWTINFPEAGKYNLQIRYAAPSDRPGNIIVNGKTIGRASFPSTGSWNNWELSSANYTVTEPGDLPVSVTALNAEGLPNIDYLSIMSYDGGATTASATCLEHPGATSIGKNDNQNIFSVYPVPANDKLIVTSSMNFKNIQIFGVDGTLVKSINNINNYNIEVPCSNLNEGLYIIQTTIGNETYIKKFNILR